MKKYLKLLVCILIFFPDLSPWEPLWGSLWAADFGLVLDQTAGYDGFTSNGTAANSSAVDYSGTLVPWFSAVAGCGNSVHISASVKVNWENDTLTYVPELLRTEFSWSFSHGKFKLGRMPYTDPLGYIAAGLFDGASISLDAGGGSVSLGAWYTGLLYKERANITMTPAELKSYNTVLDYEDFTNTYFAPRRVISVLGWEHPNLAERARIQLALLGQFDLAAEDSLHSQYLTGKLSVPVNALVFDLGGCLELMEFSDKYKIALAGELGVSWMFTAARLSLSGRYAGGVTENNDSMITAFLPLSTVYQGEILKAKFSGLSVVSLNYLGRLHRTFSTGLAASCFMRSDLGTYTGYPITAGADDGYILGTEMFGRLLWAPVSDIQINLGGGAFLPALGNVDRNAAMHWRVEMNFILAL